MSEIRIFMLGKFSIEVDGVIHKSKAYKAQELLAYLLLHQDTPHTREHLADILWGEITPEQSKSYLRKVIWQLQSILKSIGGQDLLFLDVKWIQFNPRFKYWLDVAIFEKAFNSTQGIRGKDIDDVQAQDIQRAVEMYRGGLLEGWYQDWCLYEREHLQYLYVAMLDKLMDYCEARGEYEKALAFGERILHLEKAHERAHRWLMRLHYLTGDRTSALRQYKKCVVVLRDELNVEPAEETRLLYDMIRRDRLEDPPQAAEPITTNGEKEPLTAVLNHLNAFHKELSRIQNKLFQDMRFIQRTIRGNHR